MRSVATSTVRLDRADLHGSVSDPLLDAMNFLNEIVSRYPQAVSFAPGRPYDDLLDAGMITDCLAAYTAHLTTDCGYTAEQARTALMQYGPTNGIIRDLLARTVTNDEGIHAPAKSYVVTVGAQEGMLLVLRALFATPSDVLLVASPCYVGITGAARLLDIPVVPVPEGEYGVDPVELARIVGQVRASGRRPRALYLVPDFANPSGVSLDTEARTRLLDCARTEDLLLLEDNPYGFFRADGVPVRPTLKSLDTDGRVIYLGSLAKTGFPGARVGYVIADQPVDGAGGAGLLADELCKIKSMTTVNTPAVAQAVIGGLLVRSGLRMRTAAAPAITFYQQNMRRLLDALERHFPAPAAGPRTVHWNRPEGGFFVVVSVPFDADAAALVRSARHHQVLWTPMRDFYTDGGGTHQLRLSCSSVRPEQVDEGIGRLAAFVAEESRPDPADRVTGTASNGGTA